MSNPFDKMLNINNKEFNIFESSYLRFLNPFENFDINLFDIKFSENSKTDEFIVKYAYSLDGKNFSNHVSKDNFVIDPLYASLPLYISVYFERKIYSQEFEKIQPSTIYHKNNIVHNEQYLIIEYVKYNGEEIDLFDKKSLKVITLNDLINQYPRWNLYDNQDVTINRWIRQCSAISEMYGHSCIYFKTDPKETSNTLRNNYLREVTEIKKIHILFPNNEIGSVDKIVYSDWDMPLQDDFICHIVVENFFQAFGENQIPNEKDFIYIPFLNKMFSVGVVQPVNKFMGKIAWWEANLLKYEDDETVSINKELEESVKNIPEFERAIDMLTSGDLLNIYGDDYLEESNKDNIIDQIEDYKEDTENSMEKIWEETIDEKKQVTENLSNKLVDSTWYVSMKETEKIREYYDKRLTIINVTTQESLYPLNMYDNRKVDKNVVAMQYKLTDFTEKSKNNINGDLISICFNYIPMDKFNGSVIDVLNDNGVVSMLEINFNRLNKFSIISNLSQEQQIIDIDYKLTLKEIYQIYLELNKKINQLSFKIIGLKNKEKTILYENIYNCNYDTDLSIGYLHLFGGDFISGAIEIKSDNKEIMKDYCNPLLIMNKITG